MRSAHWMKPWPQSPGNPRSGWSSPSESRCWWRAWVDQSRCEQVLLPPRCRQPPRDRCRKSSDSHRPPDESGMVCRALRRHHCRTPLQGEERLRLNGLDKKNKKKKMLIQWNMFLKTKKKSYLEEYVAIQEIGRGNFGSVIKVKIKNGSTLRAAKIIKGEKFKK